MLIKKIDDIELYDKDRKSKGIFINKDGEPVGVIILVSEVLIKIEIYTYKRNVVTIMATADNDNKTIHIGDIITNKICAGNGTIAMNHLIEYTKENNYLFITGVLSDVDKDHFDRLEHFYNKFGFDVTFNKNRTEGEIYLNL